MFPTVSKLCPVKDLPHILPDPLLKYPLLCVEPFQIGIGNLPLSLCLMKTNLLRTS
jgi:hypothetical protein